MQQLYRRWCRPGTQLYAWCLGITVLWRLGLEVLNQAVVPNMSVGPGGHGLQVLHPGIAGLARWIDAWDGAWYRTITQHGYVIEHHFRSYESVAFFPLFPYLVRWTMLVTHLPYQLIGLGLNVLLTSLLVLVIYKLTHLLAVEHKVRKGMAETISRLAAVFVLINPSAFFFVAYYADALLVLLVAAAVYAAYREKYWLAGLLAGLATAAKSIGVVGMPVILLIYAARHKNQLLKAVRRDWLKLAGVCVLAFNGLIAYMFYLWVRFGDPLVFIKVEKYWNRNVSGFFLNSIWGIWYEKTFNPVYFKPMSNYLYELFLMSIPIAVVAFAVYLVVRHRLEYAWLAALSVLAVLIPMSTGTLQSLNRYVLLLTPALAYLFVHVYARWPVARKFFAVAGYMSGVGLVVFVLIFLSYRFAG